MAPNQKIVKPLKIDQVCLVVKDLKKFASQLESLLNIGPFEFKETDRPDAILRGEKTHVRAQRAYAQAGPMELELIEPGEGDNAFREFLHNKGEGVHHFGILVSDMEAELARFKEQGVKVLQSWESARTRIAYLDTEGILGVVLELRQRK
jgi:4-hydroxyphenylpyruvate dioxygenase-like putative hemolysin